MTKTELDAAVQAFMSETKAALQIVYDALNQGQQKKLVKDGTVKKLFDRFGVEYSE